MMYINCLLYQQITILFIWTQSSQSRSRHNVDCLTSHLQGGKTRPFQDFCGRHSVFVDYIISRSHLISEPGKHQKWSSIPSDLPISIIDLANLSSPTTTTTDPNHLNSKMNTAFSIIILAYFNYTSFFLTHIHPSPLPLIPPS